jgi:hypothetical protein
MKMNIEVLFVIFLIIVNLLIGGFFLYLIFTVDAPKMSAEISIDSITSENIKLETKLDVNNPNLFDLVVKEINVISETKNGNEFTSFSFSGGEVSGNSEQSFSTLKSIELNGNVPRELYNIITADVGVKFLGVIEKNIPVELKVIVSLDKFLDEVKIPEIKIGVGITELTEEGLFFEGDIEIVNSNDIELEIEDIVLDLKTEEGLNVGNLELKGGVLGPNSKLNLDATGNIQFKALDAKQINIDILGKANAKIAGISQSLNLTASAILEIPSLSNLLNFENKSFVFSLFGEFKIRVRGIITTITFEIQNPSQIPLVTKDIVCYIYGITGENKKVIVEKLMEPCQVDAEDSICIQTTLNIPYLKLLTSGTGRILPKWITIALEGYLAFEGTSQSIPISINGNLDPHLFT